jgi:hypothetical protein
LKAHHYYCYHVEWWLIHSLQSHGLSEWLHMRAHGNAQAFNYLESYTESWWNLRNLAFSLNFGVKYCMSKLMWRQPPGWQNIISGKTLGEEGNHDTCLIPFLDNNYSLRS